MDFNQLLKDDIQCFIKANALTDLAKLALKKNLFPDVDYKLILNQIESRQKSKTKLPTWFLTENIIYGSSCPRTSHIFLTGRVFVFFTHQDIGFCFQRMVLRQPLD